LDKEILAKYAKTQSH